MKSVYSLIIVVALILSIFFIAVNIQQPTKTSTINKTTEDPTFAELVFGQHTMRVEVVKTLEDRQRGLSGRNAFAKNIDGMFFIFPDDGYHGIWMKDMLFPIDIVWFDNTLTVIAVRKNAQPESYLEIFTPSMPARYVLEVSSGFTETYEIEIGDKFQFLADGADLSL